VPLSNYAGWLLTSLFLVAAFQLIAARRAEDVPAGSLRSVRCWVDPLRIRHYLQYYDDADYR
jgi:hypothetical protein